MKTFRTILLSLLIVSLVIPCTVGSANEINLQAEDRIYEESKVLTDALGIFEGMPSWDSADKISRIEFAGVSTRLLNHKAAGYTGEFTDVDATMPFAAELSSAAKLGIVSGTGFGAFLPNDNVTYSQAVKMIVVALGLGDIADALGGWPVGYLQVANRLDIADGINDVSTNGLTYRDAVVLASNVLLSDYVNIGSVSLGGGEPTIKYSDSGETVLSKFFDYEIIEGVVWESGKASMKSDIGSKDTVNVDGKNFHSDLANLEQFIGLNVKAIYNNDKNVIVIIPTAENEVMEVDADDVGFINNQKCEVYDLNNKKTTYKMADGFSPLKNYVKFAGTYSIPNDGKFFLIDNDGDGSIDVVNMLSPEVLVVSSVVDSVAYDKNGTSYNGRQGIDLEDANIKITENGQRLSVSIDELQSGMVLSVYRNEDYELVLAEASTQLLYGGTVESVSDTKIYIDGQAYETSDYFKSNYPNTMAVGLRLNIWMDNMDRIAAAEVYSGAGSGGMQYGYYLGIAEAKGMGNTQMLLLTDTGDRITFDLDNKVYLNGTKVDAYGSEMKTTFINGTYPKYQLVKYQTNSDNVITRLDTAEDRSGYTDASDLYPETSWEYGDTLIKQVNKQVTYRGANRGTSFWPHVRSTSVIFEVPKALSEAGGENAKYDNETFRLCADLIPMNNEMYTTDIYDINGSTFSAGAAVVYRTSGGSGNDFVPVNQNDDRIYMVEGIIDVMLKNGDTTKAIKVYGSDEQIAILPELVDEFGKEGKPKMPEPGDIIQYSTNDDGYLDGINIATYNMTKYATTNGFNIKYGSGAFHQNSHADTTFYGGKIYSITDNVVVLKADITNATPTEFYEENGATISKPASGLLVLSRSTGNAVSYNRATNDFKNGISGLKTIKDVGEEAATPVIIETDWGTVANIFIYEE